MVWEENLDLTRSPWFIDFQEGSAKCPASLHYHHGNQQHQWWTNYKFWNYLEPPENCFFLRKPQSNKQEIVIEWPAMTLITMHFLCQMSHRHDCQIWRVHTTLDVKDKKYHDHITFLVSSDPKSRMSYIKTSPALNNHNHQTPVKTLIGDT